MNILLTGATGFIGQNFCNYLKNKKHSVLAISRRKTIKNKKNFKFVNSSFIISKILFANTITKLMYFLQDHL